MVFHGPTVPAAPLSTSPCDTLNATWVTAVPADLYDVVRHAYFRVALTMALLLFFAWGLVLCVQVLRRPPVDCACDEPEKRPYRLPWYTVWWQWCQTPLSLCLVAFLCLELIGLALTAWILCALTQTLRHGLPADISLVPTPPWADYLERTLPDTVHATQTQLDAASATLNDALFGWLHQAVPLAQQVLEGVEGLVSDTIRDLLGPTPLRTPVTQFANCVLGHKIEAAEHALTWLSTHAYLQLPSLPFEMWAERTWPSPWASIATVLHPSTLREHVDAWSAQEQHTLWFHALALLVSLAAWLLLLGLAAIVSTRRCPGSRSVLRGSPRRPYVC